MNILEYMEKHDYEEVAFYTDKSVGLRSIIAIHDTTLGPALGGVRIWKYASEEDALIDALRLGRAMTYKSAAAGLNLGGGKAVIMADSIKDKTEAMMKSFGRFVESLGGRYITTEDVGSTSRDMEFIATQTSHVTGLPPHMGGSGDPSYPTSIGVYEGMKACAKAVWGKESLAGKTIAVQGFGKVATFLAAHLKGEGVKLVVTDIRKENTDRAKEQFGARITTPDKIYDVPCDIFAPCALGGVLNDSTIPRLKCQVVAGCANNQLLEDAHADALAKRDILYAPDYVMNAGGVINISFELTGYDEEAALKKTREIRDTLEKVFAIAKKETISTAKAADRLVEERIAQARKVKNIHLE